MGFAPGDLVVVPVVFGMEDCDVKIGGRIGVGRDEVGDALGGGPGVGDVGKDPGLEAWVAGQRGEEGRDEALGAVGVEEGGEGGEAGDEDEALDGGQVVGEGPAVEEGGGDGCAEGLAEEDDVGGGDDGDG